VLAALLAGPVGAATITVNTTADQYGTSGAQCSLREAVRAANTDSAYGGCVAGSGTDVIQLSNGTHALTRAGRAEDSNSTGDLDVSDSIVVIGNGAAKTRIEGNGIDRLFHVLQGSTAVLYLSNLTLGGGDPVGTSNDDDIRGGAVFADGSGSLALAGVHVTGNIAIEGGGVFADSASGSTLSVSSSAFSANHAISSGGSTGTGGAIATRRQLIATNSTFSGNFAACVGSALYASTSSTENLLANVTVADNHTLHDACVAGPALWNSSPTGFIRIRNSIVAGNYSGFERADCNDVESDDYNLVGNGDDCDIDGTVANTLTNVDPQLMPLFDYGGGVPSHMILPGSPAIGAGNPASPGSGGSACLSSDQRGVDRSDCDMGAYEYRATYTVNRTTDAADANPGDGACAAEGGGCTLRAAIAEANESDDPVTIVMPPGVHRLTLPTVPNQDGGNLELEPPNALTIVGAGADLTVVLGDGNDDQMFQLFSGANALVRFSVQGGNEHSQVTAGGVAVLNDPAMLAELEIAGNAGCSGGLAVRDRVVAERLSIHDNVAQVSGGCPYIGGGVLVQQGGVLEMRNSTISGNVANEGGGGLYVDGGIARLVHVTIADNQAQGGTGGGGIARGSAGTVFLKNSIVAGNSASNGVGPDCAALIQSQDSNLIEDVSDCTIGGDTTNNLVGVDPGLTPLGLYGGKLPLHALRPGSPAIDGVGSDAGTTVEREFACRDGMLRSVPGDMRGALRPEGAFCDIGAFEGSVDVIFADGFE
jgi:CSLREA domain-containing protein